MDESNEGTKLKRMHRYKTYHGADSLLPFRFIRVCQRVGFWEESYTYILARPPDRPYFNDRQEEVKAWDKRLLYSNGLFSSRSFFFFFFFFSLVSFLFSFYFSSFLPMNDFRWEFEDVVRVKHKRERKREVVSSEKTNVRSLISVSFGLQIIVSFNLSWEKEIDYRPRFQKSKISFVETVANGECQWERRWRTIVRNSRPRRVIEQYESCCVGKRFH